MDPKTIIWPDAVRYYGYGVQKFLMKHDPILPNN